MYFLSLWFAAYNVPARSTLLHQLRLNSQQPIIARRPLLAQPQRVLGILLRPSGIARGVSQAAGCVFGHVTDAFGRVAQSACCAFDCVAEDVTEAADCGLDALLESGMLESLWCDYQRWGYKASAMQETE